MKGGHRRIGGGGRNVGRRGEHLDAVELRLGEFLTVLGIAADDEREREREPATGENRTLFSTKKMTTR